MTTFKAITDQIEALVPSMEAAIEAEYNEFAKNWMIENGTDLDADKIEESLKPVEAAIFQYAVQDLLNNNASWTGSDGHADAKNFFEFVRVKYIKKVMANDGKWIAYKQFAELSRK